MVNKTVFAVIGKEATVKEKKPILKNMGVKIHLVTKKSRRKSLKQTEKNMVLIMQ